MPRMSAKFKTMNKQDYCIEWLKLNDFQELERGDHIVLYNDSCSIKFSMMFNTVTITSPLAAHTYEKTNVFWLLGVLLTHRLITIHYKPIRKVCTLINDCKLVFCQGSDCRRIKEI